MTSTRREIRDAEFDEFARAGMPHLYRAAWLLCGDRHRAEDLVQETLTKVYAHWGSAIRNPAAYARTTLTRTWISEHRRRSSREHPVDVVPDGRGPVEDESLRLTLIDALAGLDPLDRAIVVMRYLDDTSTDEVARQLDMSSGAVRKRLMRALRRLRHQLDLPFTDLVSEGVQP